MTTDLVPSLNIEAFVAHRDNLVARIRTADTAMTEARMLARAMMPGTTVYDLELRTAGHRPFSTNVGDVVDAVDAAAWDHLLRASGLYSLMDATARDEWSGALRKHVPPLTVANVYATFEDLHAGRVDMFERGVVAVFRALSWSYKTNSPILFGKRLVLSRVVDAGVGRPSPAFDGCNRLDDLLRVCSVLDGKPEPDHRSGAYHQLAGANWPSSGPHSFGFFAVRGFKNGNAHLTFARLDLVDRLNRIVAAHHPNALPPAARQRC